MLNDDAPTSLPRGLARRALLVTSTAALTVGATRRSMAAGPVRIGIPIPLTGAASVEGRDHRIAAQFAADQINVAGGILGGRPVELMFEDDKGTPQGGVAAVQKLIFVQGVKAIGGGTNSAVVLAEQAITKGRILHMTAAAQADAITAQGIPWMFQINGTVTVLASHLNAYILDTLKPKSIAVVGENGQYLSILLSVLKETFGNAGVPITDVASYDADARDFTSILTRVKASSPDLLYVADAYPSRVTQLWQQVRQMGGFPHEVMAAGLLIPPLLRAARPYVENVVTGDIYMPSIPGQENQEFLKAWKLKHEDDPTKGQICAYDTISIIAGGMDAAKSDDAYEAIAAQIRSKSWPSPRGSLRFDAKGRAIPPYFFIQQVRDGQLAQIGEVKG